MPERGCDHGERTPRHALAPTLTPTLTPALTRALTPALTLTFHPHQVLNIKAFELQRVLEMDPGFMDLDAEHMHDEKVFSVGFQCEVGDPT